MPNSDSISSSSIPSTVPLDSLKPGDLAVVKELRLPKDQALRFLEMGFFPGEEVRLIRRSPLGDPLEVEVMGIRLGIRQADALAIQVQPTVVR